MPTRLKTGSRGLTWDTSVTTAQPGSPRTSPDTVMEGSLTNGGTLAFPTPDEADHGRAPWPHLPNGPGDGGLAVMMGTAPLFEQYFKEHQPDRGCEWVKPSMGPGDFILWDLRAVHYGAAPLGNNKRMAVYTCYKPIEFWTEEQRERKVEAFKRGYMISHDPTEFVLKED
ncbi:hypothetical protein B0J15DRAFT_472404 [Fusarium solani]|uniref:Phytanoyl-CoA dioxygenase n=1 Tax=Fusarium solani TaxID=169388 RepID=A0A9P9G4M6_FUSSL|nr:uncharacterized protein B0J15DRAFT_472404 [Fusarium solani]KAH7231995.1 hypothetical protein B0J15DRAFT_472404 [Fusarium solani]